ncbi:UPF0711 protein C18orf21-like [Haliotis asinina]|uniref:UPF0711 protein C18orf21-like n=1 Tax=Haliotis asinina TaxID=109174 RepID=UPI0035318DF1
MTVNVMEALPQTSEMQARELNDLGENLFKTQPEYSRYCIFRAKSFKVSKDALFAPHCPWCHTIFTNDNHKVRLAPRIPLTKKLKKLLDRYAFQSTSDSVSSSLLSPSLNRCQLKMVKRYLNSSNVLTVSCNTCGKTTKTKCQGRSDRARQLMSWREPVEIEKKEVSLTKKKKRKNNKESKSDLSVISPDEPLCVISNRSNQPVSIGAAKTNSKKKAVDTPPNTSATIATPDSEIEDGSSTQVSKSSTVKKKDCRQAPNGDRSSSVLSLIASLGVKSGGVTKKKKKKGRDKHQQLEKMLQEQKSVKPPTQQKNSLADFLSQMTY